MSLPGEYLGWVGRGMLALMLVAPGISGGGEPAPAVPPPPLSIRDFFRSPLINFPKLNSAGTKFAAQFATEDDHLGAVVYDLLQEKSQRICGPMDRDIEQIHWLDDGHLLFDQTKEKLYADGLFVVDAADLSRSYPIERYNAVEVVSVPVKTPMRPIVWIRRDAYDSGHDGGVVQLDARKSVDPKADELLGMRGVMTRGAEIDNGTMAAVLVHYPGLPEGMPREYFSDREGELAYAIAIDGGRESLYRLQKSKWIKSPLDLDAMDMYACGDEADEVIVLGPRQEGKPRAILRADAASGAIKGVLYQDEAYDAIPQHLFRNPKTRTIVGVQLYRRALESVWFDPELKARQQMLNRRFAGLMVSVIGTDRAEKKLVVAVYGDRQPVAYHLVDLDAGTTVRIASSAPWIPPERMRAMQSLTYKTRDGFKIEGFLTLPEGATKENPPPLVTLVHGGPWSRDSWQWDPEVQFLASRGYAVFQPNYRGSTGYNWSFPAGDGWDFQKMHNDVTDGVRKILKSGLVDPRRVAIMGASFGGYLALCGATYEPDLYRCAISEAGVFDWSIMMRAAKRERYDSSRYQVFLRNLGDPQKQAEYFAAISPLNHVEQLKIPVFIAHGKEDDVVAVEQSKRLVEELKRRQIPHRALLKRGEGHGFYRLDNQVEFYTAVEAFLTENLSKL